MSSSDLEDIVCRICDTVVEEDDIRPCKCDYPVHSTCLIKFIKNKQDLRLEAKCDICLESFDYTTKRSCTRCCARICSDMRVSCNCGSRSMAMRMAILMGCTIGFIGLAIYTSLVMLIVNGFGLTKPFTISALIAIINTIFLICGIIAPILEYFNSKPHQKLY